MKKILQDVFHVDSDANAVERAMTYFVPIGAFILFLWLYLAAMGVFPSYTISQYARTTPFGFKVIGNILFWGAFVWLWFVGTDRVKFRVNSVVAIIVALVAIGLAILFLTGFEKGFIH